MSYRKHDVHECTLQKTGRSGVLLPLAPMSSSARKFLRFMRMQALLNEHNKESRIFFRNKSSMLLEQKRQVRTCHWFIIHPFSKLSNILDWLFILIWFPSCITIPLQGVPATFSLWIESNVNVMLGVFQFLIIISFFMVGYVDYTHTGVVLNEKRIAFRYLRWYFIFDVLTVFGTCGAKYTITGRDPLEIFIFTSIATVSVMVRLPYLLNTLYKILKRLRFGKPIRFIARHSALCFIILHIFTVHVYSIPLIIYGGSFPSDSWVKKAGLDDIKSISSLDIYYECQLTVVCHFFGATYDKYPVTLPCEEIIYAIILFTGRLYTIFFMAEVLQLFGLVSISQSKYEQFIHQVDEYVKSKKLPDELSERLVRYYQIKLQRHYFNESEIRNTLSEHLKTDIFLFGARRLLEKMSMFQALSGTVIAEMLAFTNSETFLPGDTIFKAGVVTENIYFISWGTVAIYHRNGQEIGHLNDGDEFGIDLPGQEVQRYTFVAVEVSEIYYGNKKVIMQVFATYPQVWRHFQNTWSKRMSKFGLIERQMARGDTVVELLRATTLLEGRQYKYETEDAFER
ncbi:unnamed protein product [Acanthoscelides obtectus]|uniref:Cyclic nucleotide-binding domain-containing protein n=1 Tax=Acanthoscelides obtectus TaxID=200917 RepID=A0A9P0Q2R3_ACAOB|nr:unnamed protein product [Acanthoscelides obtectus]CAK1678421.1 Potassium/sodium hyperpolarization-activated cyclic nucleotide-gated channel 2 [Acanthoscelides obtectus]